ncbi:MAG: nucleotidyltransferase [Terrimonas ferruginea]|jgi:NDP-sugar pyrophosphorylase family protein|uniref:nucleotidyltransferase family protein n=1 Tax=Terrimonas ferruginea TaxID=249 RepID=UPI00092925DE|nr:sugar phosphate nucleotidyltransferase [Terrimonas ferruginea]MBN8784270.1 nucleotidyltransferase [Terrimonas ferruginea]OJW39139.1 MAG: nucleotidyltransferase [Sphingobacteriales bacterium 48-107]
MTQPTLVILAAGMASRYGSMKQIQGFGPAGETIMDYSIFDAIRSGFGKIVFIIRREFAEDFKAIFEPKLNGRVETAYVFQDMDAFTEGYAFPESRTKPWGTAHAVLCAMDVVKEPFAVINADDFYGDDAFKQAADFLLNDCNEKTYGLVGYDLLKTLSDYGTVNRGVCKLDELGNLASITERINIAKKDGKIVVDDGAEPAELSMDTRVSMNFWCFDPSFFNYTQRLFREFLTQFGQEAKSEFFIPIVADHFIREGGKVEIIPTSSSWFGVTYKEDAPFVAKSLNELIEGKVYPADLWKREA